MTKIDNLFDNNQTSQRKSLKYICSDGFIDYHNLRENLKPFSRRKIVELQKQNPGLIIFPQNLEETKDQIQNSEIFSLENEYSENPEETEVITSNIMGFLGIKGNEIHIHSRFDKKFKNDHFLHYMLSKVFFPNIIDLPHSTNENGNLNLLIFAFPILLKKALKQGLIKEYKSQNHNNPNVRGVIDIQRQIQKNIPFNGNIAFKTREHSFDNFTTQLIRHTIEYIKTTDFGSALLQQDSEVKEYIKIINQVTPTFESRDRHFVLGKNLNSKINPYYSDYIPLQKLCVQILRHENIDFLGETEGLYGILFDGAWLWEEYLNTILSKLDLIHAENKFQSKGISLFSNRKYINYPDFYKTGECIFDAKYKKISKDSELKVSIDSSDYHQMIAYMRVQDSPIGGFIYPLATEDYINVDTNDLLIGTLNGKKSLEGEIFHLPMQIPQTEMSFNNFIESISVNEKYLIKQIEIIITKSKKLN